VTVEYLGLGDFLVIAEEVLGVPAEDIAHASRLDLAESALHAYARCRALGDDAHVELQRGRVGMELDNRDLRGFPIHVLVERDDPRLVRVDEVDETGNPRRLAVEHSGVEPIRGDEDERARHRASCASGVTTRTLVYEARSST